MLTEQELSRSFLASPVKGKRTSVISYHGLNADLEAHAFPINSLTIESPVVSPLQERQEMSEVEHRKKLVVKV